MSSIQVGSRTNVHLKYCLWFFKILKYGNHKLSYFSQDQSKIDRLFFQDITYLFARMITLFYTCLTDKTELLFSVYLKYQHKLNSCFS